MDTNKEKDKDKALNLPPVKSNYYSGKVNLEIEGREIREIKEQSQRKQEALPEIQKQDSQIREQRKANDLTKKRIQEGTEYHFCDIELDVKDEFQNLRSAQQQLSEGTAYRLISDMKDTREGKIRNGKIYEAKVKLIKTFEIELLERVRE